MYPVAVLVAVLLTFSTGARAVDRGSGVVREYVGPETSTFPRRAIGIFCPGMSREATCMGPCKNWSAGQPDVQFSYDRCLKNCPKPKAGCE